jgi:hypothetical protein
LTLARVQSLTRYLLSRTRREVPRVVEELVDRVSLQVVADFLANLALDRLILRVLVALPPMLLELVERRHDDGFAERAEVLRYRQGRVDVRHVTVVGLNPSEGLVAVLTADFRYGAFVSDERLSTGEFL